jgi:uncharacterized protein
MMIRLHEIPEEGKSYKYNTKTAELNKVLNDLIGQEQYETEFTIRPINSKNYELIGFIKTKTNELCSRCGIDFKFNVNARFKEILIAKSPEDRKGKYAKVNHVSDSPEISSDFAEYNPDFTFDIGEYLHEQVAICIPFNPAPQQNDNGDCSDCGDYVLNKTFSYDEQIPEEKPQSPFKALKNLKL